MQLPTAKQTLFTFEFCKHVSVGGFLARQHFMNDKEFCILSIYHHLKQVRWNELRDKHTAGAEYMDWAENKADVQMVVSVINTKLESYNLIERIPRTIALDQTSKITAQGEELYLVEARKRNLFSDDANQILASSSETASSMHPVVFISYSWDDETHKSWVLNLADLLRANGIRVLLDVYELTAGKNITHFIENAIRNSDRIIVVFTPNYKLKADNRKGGVGFEYSIINLGLYKNIANNETVIPLLRLGSVDESIPDFLQQYVYIDFSNDGNFKNKFTDLLREVHKEPKLKKAEIGQKPDFSKINSDEITNVFERNGNIFCTLPDSIERQLTFSNSDSNPLLLTCETAIVFIRNTFGDYDHPNTKKIMKVNYENLLETTITSKKSYVDGLVCTEFIYEIANPTLALDQKSIYFLTEAYATSGNLAKVNLETGNWEIISDAMDFELIEDGVYRNLFSIGKSQIKERGRDIYYYLINEKNETLKEFITKENYIEFKKNIHRNN